MDELTRKTAREVVALLCRGEVTPVELIEAAAARIAAVEPAVNALPTLCLERARDRARALMARPPEERGPLAGLPLVVKDLDPVAGVRTTLGSPIYADSVPERSDIMVETLEARGGIVIGKSNTPEFGAGANTFNEVFGKTLNPWDTRKTCGGSSGGSAVALASGECWLATGSDLGGSLRTPASFCSVVGFRPSPGRVAEGPNPFPFNSLAVNGPMARTVGDAALMLDAMVGRHPEDPRSFDPPRQPFVAAVDEPTAPRRVAFSPDLGVMPVDPEVAAICARAAARFAETGAAVEQATPDFSGAGEAFQSLRAAGFVASFGALYETDRDRLKPEIVWNIEAGLALSATDIARAERLRGALFHRIAGFFRDHDLLLCPAAAVPPFDVEQRYVEAIGETRFDNYIDWLGVTYAVTLTSCPAISVPCGFTAEGLPVGLQIVGPPRGEAAVLSAAALFEARSGIAARLPIDPRAGS